VGTEAACAGLGLVPVLRARVPVVGAAGPDAHKGGGERPAVRVNGGAPDGRGPWNGGRGEPRVAPRVAVIAWLVGAVEVR